MIVRNTHRHDEQPNITCQNASRPPSRRPDRVGAAFFMIVFILLIVVVGTIKLFLRRELADQRNLIRQHRSDAMNAAIDNVIASVPDDRPNTQPSRWKLPLDPQSTNSILVQWDDANSTWSAKWMLRDAEIDSLIRPLL